MKRALTVAALVALPLALFACAAPPAPLADEPMAPTQAPAGLTVRAEVHVRDTIAAARFSSGVYVIEPDGTLRVAETQPRTPRFEPMPALAVTPPVLRRLDASEIDRLWRLIGPTSLADPANPERLPPSQDWYPPANRSVAMLEVHDQNGSRRFAIALNGATPAAIDGRALLERIQTMAWRTPQPAIAGP